MVTEAKWDGWRAEDFRPYLDVVGAAFGAERLMFGSDWPVCTLRASFRQWVGALKEIVQGMNMSLADQKKLFHDNAVRFYGLKDKGYRPA